MGEYIVQAQRYLSVPPSGFQNSVCDDSDFLTALADHGRGMETPFARLIEHFVTVPNRIESCNLRHIVPRCRRNVPAIATVVANTVLTRISYLTSESSSSTEKVNSLTSTFNSVATGPLLPGDPKLEWIVSKSKRSPPQFGSWE